MEISLVLKLNYNIKLISNYNMLSLQWLSHCERLKLYVVYIFSEYIRLDGLLSVYKDGGIGNSQAPSTANGVCFRSELKNDSWFTIGLLFASSRVNGKMILSFLLFKVDYIAILITN